jgi:acyl-CoA synthetase (AMP-forming)/AMP-acid ligase II
MSGDPARAELDARILTWMREPWIEDDARFDALARELFVFQYEHCEPYARFCSGRGVTPQTLTSWDEIPPVPTGAFKEVQLRSFEPARECHVFRTSGTTGESRGELHLDTLELYETSLLPTFERFVLPDLAPRARSRLLILSPSPEELPDSSLSHMLGVVLAALGDEASRFFVRNGELEQNALIGALQESDRPVTLCGTAFSFVHLLDALAERGLRLELPRGSRVMETGGFKGRTRERSREGLYAEVEARLGIPAHRIVNQYGMTELGSQFYDTVLREPDTPRRKLGPPWARVRVLDPGSGMPCAPGEVGIVALYDLANTGSIAAIQTADLGRTASGGFAVLGRAPGAEARGCSIALDEMLGGA